MSKGKNISEWQVGRDPDVIWVKTKSGVSGVATHYDCGWMRHDPDCEDVDDAFTWYFDDSSNHIELPEIECWRLATQAEKDAGPTHFEERD